MQIVISSILFLWLLLCSIQDIKRKRINIYLLFIGFLVLLLCTIWNQEVHLFYSLGGISIGLILLGISFITRGQIGMGDGLIVCITGMSLGFSKNAMLLGFGLFGSAIYSMILLSFKLANRKKTIPFVPFLLCGYVGVLLFG